MNKHLFGFSLALLTAAGGTPLMAQQPLGLPPVPIPADNLQTPEKIALGDKLFHDKRFSSDGTVSCSTCHDAAKGFTDSPLAVSQGIASSDGSGPLTGTRNAPTVINAAYFPSQFWDGRSPSLEDQSQHPFVNPVEMGLKDHTPILEIVRSDPEYVQAFETVFNKTGDQISMDEVKKAIASFERVQIAGDSPFDQYYFGGEGSAMSAEQIRGFEVFLNQGRCVSCHTIEQNYALFTDGRFHNIGVGINNVQDQVPPLATAFLQAKTAGLDVDAAVLSDSKTSELGRFAVTETFDNMGAFKTSTLRNIAATPPYMHDGSLNTLREVVEHYNNGGKSNQDDKVNDFLSGGIRPLNLSEQQIDDLVAFMQALTSPQYADQARADQ